MVEKNVPTPFDSAETLQAWAVDIEREIAEITASILPLQQRLDAAREKLDLVRRLISISMRGNYGTLPASQATALPEIEDRIEEVLQSNGKPMHITDIRATLIRIGVPLPGRGDEANIILRLRRASERFVRTGRGTYALTAWKIPEYSPAPSRKRVRRRRRTVP